MSTLNCTELDQFDNPDVLPEGDYNVAIVSGEVGPTKSDPASEMITLKAQVLDGKSKGHTLFFRFCTRHKNPQAQNMGRAAFKALRTAVGRMNPRDTVELQHIPFTISLKCKNGPNGMQNEVKKYTPHNRGPAPAAAAVAQQAQAPWAQQPAPNTQDYAPPAAGGDGAALMNGVPYADAARMQPATYANGEPAPF